MSLRTAILGATSQLARDLVLSFSLVEPSKAQANPNGHDLELYARRPDAVRDWLAGCGLAGRYQVFAMTELPARGRIDAILNFVGVGDPAKAAAMGSSIFEVTHAYDELVLAYLRRHPGTRYFFMSSGAAFGQSFEQPADEYTPARFALNRLQPQDWYGLSKLHAEARHRSMPELPIIDIRVYNYFSATQDLSARFLATDILRAIQQGKVLRTSPDNIMRDFLHPIDFHALVASLLAAPPSNDVVDAYTRAPIDKVTLLAEMRARFGLKYDFVSSSAAVNATGVKPHYYSVNRRAGHYGYIPAMTSLEGLVDGFSRVLQGASSGSNSSATS